MIMTNHWKWHLKDAKEMQYRLFIILLVIFENAPNVLATINISRTKEIPFPDHVDSYENTLIWAIKIHPENSHDSHVFNSNHGIRRSNLEEFFAKEIENEDETLKETSVVAKKVASEMNLVFLGDLGSFKNWYLAGYNIDARYGVHNRSEEIHFSTLHELHRRSLDSELFEHVGQEIEDALESHGHVTLYSRQRIISRQKRSLHFDDPCYPKQWHLHNTQTLHMDINVTGVWERHVNGSGITVAVVDDGVEWTNRDIKDNYNTAGSWDLNANDPDPMPNGNKASNHHGTRCAGEITAVPNTYCSVGVAYGAKVSGIRVLDGPMTDSLEASAFNKYLQINDIYSCSWGPDDDGKTVDGPHVLAAAALQYGINFGRHGYGSIYVVASGNGGRYGDNCNYDGYANSVYTVTIGAVGEKGHMPFYAEECASMLAVTFSSGYKNRSIVTTDWTKNKGTGCTETHSGTSAAAPIAAGMIALMLQVRKCLTWRDVQYIIVMTAQKVDVDLAHWQRNGAGLYHSHKHGFGLMKAWRLVNAAKVWEMVPWITSYTHESSEISTPIPKSHHNPLSITYTLTEEAIAGYDLFIMEYVQLTVTITHPYRGLIEISLGCPSGTKSLIGATRPKDNSSLGFSDWTFSTVRCWGESPVGTWEVTIKDTDTSKYGSGYLKSWKLKIFGTPMTPEQFKERRKLIHKAMSGEFLRDNYSLPCPPPPVVAKPDVPMSLRTLKILALASIFCLAMALYETMEYMLCYNEEKREQKKLMGLNKQAQQMVNRRDERNSDPSENVGLLEMEEIPLNEIPSSNSGYMQNGHMLDEIENEDETVEFDLGTSYVAAKGRKNVVNEEIQKINNSSHSTDSGKFETKHSHDVSDSTFSETGHKKLFRVSGTNVVKNTQQGNSNTMKSINKVTDSYDTTESINAIQSHGATKTKKSHHAILQSQDLFIPELPVHVSMSSSDKHFSDADDESTDLLIYEKEVKR